MAQAQNLPDPFSFSQLTERKVFKRWWYLAQRRVNPPSGALVRGLDQRKNASLAQASWSSLGPQPINYGSTAWTGRVSTIAVDPSQPDHWLLGGAQGGIWESQNAGITWTPRTDSQPSLASGAIAFAPSNPQIVYAGTGEPVFSGDAYGGVGLLKSLDGGQSWTHISDDSLLGTAFSQIHVSPTDPQVLNATVGRGIFGREAGRYPGDLLTGVLISTNGGQSWTRTLEGVGTDLEIDPGDFQKQWAALGDAYTKSENGVYRSSDAGQTWAAVTGPWSGQSVGRVELALDPQAPNTLYVSIQDGFDNQSSDGKLLGVWRTSNAGDPVPSWTALPIPRDANQWWYDHALAVDPINSEVYLGGQQLWRLNDNRWINITQDIHVDQHTIIFSGNRVIVGNDGGIYQSTNQGNNWTNLNQTLALTQYYEGSLHPTNPQRILAGSQDNGTHAWNGDSWRWIFGGDGTDNAISSTKPDTDWAVSYQFLAIHRTTNGGASFGYVGSGIDLTNAPFIARFELCPSQPDLLIAGTDNLWRTEQFFSAANPLWVANSPELGSPLTALAFGTECATYALGTEDGQIWLTRDGGITWTDLDLDQQVPQRAITDLALDSRGLIWVTLAGFASNTPDQPGHLFMRPLATGGAWQNLSPPLDLPHNTVAIASGGAVYVGTDLGVWQSMDQGASWQVLGTGLPNVAVFELQINQDQLVAFTHGRGVFSTSIAPTLQVIPQTTTLNSPLNSEISLGLSLERVNFNGAVDLVVTGLPVGVAATFGSTEGANTTLTLQISNSTRTGIYPLVLTAQGVILEAVTLDLVIADPTALTDQTVELTAGGLVRVDRLRQQVTVSQGQYLGLTLPPGIEVTSPTVRSTGTPVPLIPISPEPFVIELANSTPNTASYSPTVLDINLGSTNTAITTGGFVSIQRLRQQVTVRNTGTATLAGPFYLTVVGLTPGATLTNGTTQLGGLPAVGLDLARLDPGSSTVVLLEFENPTVGPLTYTLNLASGALSQPD